MDTEPAAARLADAVAGHRHAASFVAVSRPPLIAHPIDGTPDVHHEVIRPRMALTTTAPCGDGKVGKLVRQRALAGILYLRARLATMATYYGHTAGLASSSVTHRSYYSKNAATCLWTMMSAHLACQLRPLAPTTQATRTSDLRAVFVGPRLLVPFSSAVGKCATVQGAAEAQSLGP